MLALPWPAVE